MQFVGAIFVLLSGWGAASNKNSVVDLRTFTCIARFVEGVGGGAQQLLIQNQLVILLQLLKDMIASCQSM